MNVRWQHLALGLFVLAVAVPTAAAGGWATDPFPPVDGDLLVGPDGVAEETATVEVRPDGDGIVTVTATTTGPVEDDLEQRLTRGLEWRYGDDIAREATVTVEDDRIQIRYRVPDVAVDGPGETMIVDALYSSQRRPIVRSVDRLRIEGPAWDQAVGSDGTAIERSGAVEGVVEPGLVAFAPAGPAGRLAGTLGLYEYRAIASVAAFAGLATWPLLMLALAVGFVWTGPRIEQASRSMERFEAGYIASVVLGLFGVGIAVSSPDLASLAVDPVGAPVAGATALAPLVLGGTWWLVGSDRGPHLDPDRLVGWSATLGAAVVVTIPLVAGIHVPGNWAYRLLAALVPVVGAIPIVIARGSDRTMVAIGLLAAPIAVAIASSPTMLGPDVGPVYKVYALVVAACILGSAQLDRRRLLGWQSADADRSASALTEK